MRQQLEGSLIPETHAHTILLRPDCNDSHTRHAVLAVIVLSCAWQLAATVAFLQEGGSPGIAETVSPWRGEGRGADPAAVVAALVSLLLGYLDTALPQFDPSSQEEASSAATMQVVCLVTLCMHGTRRQLRDKQYPKRHLKCWQ